MTFNGKSRSFLLRELIRRDFIKKYKRTTFGILWSALSPLFLLLIMDLVFGTFFGRNMSHYTIYLFSGLLLYNYFASSTKGALSVLYSNASIYTKVPVPKIYFILSHSTAQFINFLVSLAVYFVFVALDGISFKLSFFALIYPTLCLYLINLGISIFLSTVYIFFRDINYLWPLLCRVIMYASAIFYDVSILPNIMRRLLKCNPLYMCIDYFRQVVIHNSVPTLSYNLMLCAMTVFCLLIGGCTYRICRDKIPLYV